MNWLSVRDFGKCVRELLLAGAGGSLLNEILKSSNDNFVFHDGIVCDAVFYVNCAIIF